MKKTAIDLKMTVQVPDAVRDLAAKTIDHAEKAFGMFFDARKESVGVGPKSRRGNFQTGAVVYRTEHQGCARPCAEISSGNGPSTSNANPIGIFEEPVHKCRAACATNHRRNHVICERWPPTEALNASLHHKRKS
jgi:hypothetical protein